MEGKIDRERGERPLRGLAGAHERHAGEVAVRVMSAGRSQRPTMDRTLHLPICIYVTGFLGL